MNFSEQFHATNRVIQERVWSRDGTVQDFSGPDRP